MKKIRSFIAIVALATCPDCVLIGIARTIGSAMCDSKPFKVKVV